MISTDLAKAIADAAGKAATERFLAMQAETAETHGRVSSPAALTPEVLAAAANAGVTEQRRAVRDSTGRVFDPKGGKGCELARLALTRHFAQKNPHVAAKEIARHLGFGAEFQKALSEGSFADGGSLVPDQVSAEFIELLRPSTVVFESGARQIDFKGSLSFGRQNSTATAAWIGEAANITPSSPGTGMLQLQAKKLGALVPISNDLMRNPSAGIEAFVRDDLLKAFARKLDLTLLEGLGTAYAPKGIDTWVNSANSNAITGTALADKVSDLGRAIRLVEAADVGITRGGWVLHPRTKWALMTTLDSQGNFVFMQEMLGGSLFGYPYRTTTALTASSTNYKFYFGEWPELVVGVDTAMDIETGVNVAYHNGSAVVAGFSTDESGIRAIGRFDSVMRHNLAFSVTSAVSY